jgi:hypothetical protein
MPTNIDVNKVEFIPFAYEPRLVRGIGQHQFDNQQEFISLLKVTRIGLRPKDQSY